MTIYFKYIWRFLLKKYKNSKLQVAFSKVFEILKFEGFYVSYSQFGEDLIIENIFRDRKRGFYIDVGCNRPIEGNNTFKLYLNGWNGINIDGNSSLIDSFNKIRKKDINICAIISNTKEKIKFYISDDDRVSTVSEDFKEWIKDDRKYGSCIEIIPHSLNEILEQQTIQIHNFDFLNIDVEGHDLEVLQSIDLEKYRPEIICIEDHLFDFNHLENSVVYSYLIAHNYNLIAFSKPNLYFKAQ